MKLEDANGRGKTLARRPQRHRSFVVRVAG
jgi:hypothetical protein